MAEAQEIRATFEGKEITLLLDPGEWLAAEASYIFRQMGIIGLNQIKPYVENLSPEYIAGVVAISARRAGFPDKLADIYGRVKIGDFMAAMSDAVDEIKAGLAESEGEGPTLPDQAG